MKILNLSLDNSVLNKDSGLAKRVVEYGGLFEKYAIIVPAKENKEVRLSDNTKAYGVKSGNKAVGLFKICVLAKKLMKQDEFNAITVQDQYFLGFMALRLARKFKIGLEIQVHGFEKYGGLRKLIARYVLPRADSVRVVSQRLKRRLVSEFGAAEDAITVAPIFSDFGCRISDVGFRMSDFGSLNKKGKENGGKFIFLTVGRLVPVKNIEMQIEALANYELRIANCELWIVGEGPERKNYELRITNYKLNNKIKLFGWRDDLDKFYRQADAFILTSDSEGWGLAVIEAAARGLPIVMTDVGCAGEVIKDGESGIVIPAGDRRKLEEAMVKLIEDESLRRRLGSGAQEAVRRLPSKEEALELYKQSLEKAA